MRKIALLLVLSCSVLGACAKKSSTPVQSPSNVGGQAPDGAASDDPAGGNPPGAPASTPGPGTNAAPSSSDPCMGGE